MEHLLRCAIPLNTLWMCILWFLLTLQRGAVNETDSGILAEQGFLDEYGGWNGNILFQFYESVV